MMTADPVDKFAAEIGLTPRLVDVYYDSVRKEFVVRNKRGCWQGHTATQFAMLMRVSGVATKTVEAERIMTDTIEHWDVGYVGRLAGRTAGFHEANGVRMIITEGPQLIEPAEGPWPTIRALIHGLLGADPEFGEIQVNAFLCWMRSAFEAVSRRKWTPSQILALAGPVNCGKSLLQRLITVCLGNRAAGAFGYLSGATDFNRDLFGAEHLVIEDEQASTDYRARMQMAAHLKGIAVNKGHRCHGKGREAVNLEPIWRCSISLNDEGECLLVLPPLRSDIADKIHILRCFMPAEPFPTDNMDMREAFWGKLVSEVPAFLHSLAVAVPLPGRAETRFGVVAFHHPTLVEELETQAPEIVLLELIDLEVWRDVTLTEWEGTARDLETLLLDSTSKVKEQARRLFTFGNACGTYIGRLSKSHPERIVERRTADRRGWEIKKPRQMTS